LAFDKVSKLLTTIPSISNNILWKEPAIGVSCVTKNTAIVNRGISNIGGYGNFIMGICKKVEFITKV